MTESLWRTRPGVLHRSATRQAPDPAKRSVVVEHPLSDAGEADSVAPVTDRNIAIVIAVLADEYEEMDAMLREGLLTRLWHFFSALRENGH